MSDQADATVAGVEAEYAEAYSAADPQRLGAIFTTGATVQTEWGPILDGRGQITDGLAALFAAKPVPDALVNVPLISRQLTADVIVSHGKALRRPPGGPEDEFLYTWIYVNNGGRWLPRRIRSRDPANTCARAASVTESHDSSSCCAPVSPRPTVRSLSSNEVFRASHTRTRNFREGTRG